jgi:hypothetical protein
MPQKSFDDDFDKTPTNSVRGDESSASEDEDGTGTDLSVHVDDTVIESEKPKNPATQVILFLFKKYFKAFTYFTY